MGIMALKVTTWNVENFSDKSSNFLARFGVEASASGSRLARRPN
jgi:hypothetical protein